MESRGRVTTVNLEGGAPTLRPVLPSLPLISWPLPSWQLPSWPLPSSHQRRMVPQRLPQPLRAPRLNRHLRRPLQPPRCNLLLLGPRLRVTRRRDSLGDLRALPGCLLAPPPALSRRSTRNFQASVVPKNDCFIVVFTLLTSFNQFLGREICKFKTSFLPRARQATQ